MSKIYFQVLPQEYTKLISEITNSTIQKLYSNFTIKYLPYSIEIDKDKINRINLIIASNNNIPEANF